MPCPKCNSTNIIQRGNYNGRKNGRMKKRFQCKDCKRYFIIRSLMYAKSIPLAIRRDIVRLYRTKKGYVCKYDGMKKKTYSTREIALLTGVSKSRVFEIIKTEG